MKIEKECLYCKKAFTVYPYRADTAKYCSASCGRLSSPTLGQKKYERIIKPNGYAMVRADGKYVYEHRHTVEQNIGRKLISGEVVHHKDGNKLNNEIGNLEVLKRKEHDKAETQKRWAEKGYIVKPETKRCGKPLASPRGKGKFCRRTFPCAYHQGD